MTSLAPPLQPPASQALARLSPTVWALGFTSLFMDISSEMIHAVLPLFVVLTLGSGPLVLGVIEGVAEATACIVKVFSGVLSDRFARRKPLALAGYGLAALTKPLFPLAGSVATVFAARFVDRIGKGIRGAPRDALVADVTPPAQRGAAYGLRQTLDTVGAFTGPLLAIGLLLVLRLPLKSVLWLAVLPAFVAVAVLWAGVREPVAAPASLAARPQRHVDLDWRRLPPAFWVVTGIATVFMLARFSEAFLVLLGPRAGLGVALAPVSLVVMNLAYMLSAYPVGYLADRWPRPRLLALGCVVLVLANGLLAMATSVWWLLPGVALWGLHMGLTEGVFAAMVADAAPASLRGTAFGVFNLLRGLMLLAASVLAGGLWQWQGPAATFVAGAALALATLLALGLAGQRWPALVDFSATRGQP